MNKARRVELGKMFFDISKYFATIVGGTFLLKPEVVTVGLGIKTSALVLILLTFAWYTHPKGDKK